MRSALSIRSRLSKAASTSDSPTRQGRLVASIRWLTRLSPDRVDSKPHLPLRIAVFALRWDCGALLRLLFNYPASADRVPDFIKRSTRYQLDCHIGAAILFLITWETRIKRARALRPSRTPRHGPHRGYASTDQGPRRTLPGADTASSPKRSEPLELSRYLNYCSEALSLIGKIAPCVRVSGFGARRRR
jgi:hypothetical protein